MDGSIDLTKRIKSYFRRCGKKPVALKDMLQEIGESTSTIFSAAPCYKNIRCCRLLALAGGHVFDNTQVDWKLLAGMSPHVAEVLNALGLVDWKYVLQFVMILRNKVSDKNYNINDFTIFLGLFSDVEID
jgi:hypothetical protein